MAKCPKCSITQDWRYVIEPYGRLKKCTGCGSYLEIDSRRATILLGGWVAYMALPETSLIPFDWNFFWFVFTVITYFPFYVWYTKLNVVKDIEFENLNVNESFTEEFLSKRRTLERISRSLIKSGLTLLILTIVYLLFVKTANTLSGVLMVLGIALGVTGIFITGFGKCPSCKRYIMLPSKVVAGVRCPKCRALLGGE